MPSISESIIIGVVSGVTTSFVVWLAISLFKGLVLPWYQSLVYRGIQINGPWIGFLRKDSKGNILSRGSDDEANPHFSIFIEQKGHVITAEIIAHKNLQGKHDPKTFSAEGVFRDGNLIVLYQPKDTTRLGMGSYVMKLVHDGRKLEGKCTLVSAVYGNVADVEVEWIRKPN